MGEGEKKDKKHGTIISSRERSQVVRMSQKAITTKDHNNNMEAR